MTTLLFLTSSKAVPENWDEAFPVASLLVGLPKDLDAFDCTIILMDLTGLSEAEKKRWLISALSSQKKVVVLSATPNEDEALTVIKQGAVGYGHSHSAPRRLQEMVVVVEHGGLWVGRKILKRILSGVNQITLAGGDLLNAASNQENLLDDLSSREAMVAKEVAIGSTNLEISQALGITERTVKAHITSIFEKLGVRNRVELALKYNKLSVPHIPASKAS